MSVSQRARRAAARRSLLLTCVLLAGCATAGQGGPEPQSPDRAIDWLARSYTLTCDGIVPEGFRAPVVGGIARVPADPDRPPHYAHYDVSIEATSRGDVDGDGAPDTVVLLACSPQPSNGILQEVQVFSSTGRRLGSLPSPRTLRDGTELPPVYDPTRLTVEAGDIVAGMTAYAPRDSHASGPSVTFTVRWRYDGTDFVRVSSP